MNAGLTDLRVAIRVTGLLVASAAIILVSGPLAAGPTPQKPAAPAPADPTKLTEDEWLVRWSELSERLDKAPDGAGRTAASSEAIEFLAKSGPEKGLFLADLRFRLADGATIAEATEHRAKGFAVLEETAAQAKQRAEKAADRGAALEWRLLGARALRSIAERRAGIAEVGLYRSGLGTGADYGNDAAAKAVTAIRKALEEIEDIQFETRDALSRLRVAAELGTATFSLKRTSAWCALRAAIEAGNRPDGGRFRGMAADAFRDMPKGSPDSPHNRMVELGILIADSLGSRLVPQSVKDQLDQIAGKEPPDAAAIIAAWWLADFRIGDRSYDKAAALLDRIAKADAAGDVKAEEPFDRGGTPTAATAARMLRCAIPLMTHAVWFSATEGGTKFADDAQRTAWEASKAAMTKAGYVAKERGPLMGTFDFPVRSPSLLPHGLFAPDRPVPPAGRRLWIGGLEIPGDGKAVTLVVDANGSLDPVGDFLKDAVVRGIAAQGPDRKFDVSFATDNEPKFLFAKSPEPATPARQIALAKFLAGNGFRGATFLPSALIRSVDRSGGHVIVVTDGDADTEFVDAMIRKCRGRCAVHCLFLKLPENEGHAGWTKLAKGTGGQVVAFTAGE